MSNEFPKVDISRPADLDHVMATIRARAIEHLTEQLVADGLAADVKAKHAAEAAIERWIESGKLRLRDNILVNGLTFREYAKHQGTMEPFDEALSQRVQSLAEQVDTLTAQAVEARKEVPRLRAEALRQRADALDRLELEHLAQERAHAEEQARNREAVVEPQDLPKVERPEEVARSLRQAVDHIESLQTSLLENATAVQEQTRLVRKLRSMAP